ncbi:MAG: hypothetical protein L6275_02495 [Candidatus Portnoybacteria bacterium]|nr:hypothetical protein [Candidatus Portnoybacteria bacterium]
MKIGDKIFEDIDSSLPLRMTKNQGQTLEPVEEPVVEEPIVEEPVVEEPEPAFEEN